MLGVVTARCIAKCTCHSMRMNAILLLMTQPCSRGNCAWTELVVSYWR